MITQFFSRSALHTHAEPAQRLLGVEQLPSDSEDLAQLLAADPAPEVRIAAAQRCADIAALAATWGTELDPAVRAAIAAALGNVLAVTQDNARAQAMLEADHCDDAIRSDVARRAQDPERRRIAIAGISDEAPLVDLALGAEHAEIRMAAAERVQTLKGLQTLADAAKNKDRGVARLARQRIDAINDRLRQQAEADAITAQLESLAGDSGPIHSAVVGLDRRWQALDMAGDPARLACYAAARQTIQARFDREQETQRSRLQFERKLRAWIEALEPALGSTSGSASGAAVPDALAGLHTDLAALREEAQHRGDAAALSQLDQAEQRIRLWELEHRALAGAEALVVAAEQIAADASSNSASLLTRWQALDRTTRTPDLTRRFEAALLMIEQRRLERAKAAKQEASARWQRLQGLLDALEQSLVAGQLRAARASTDEIRTLTTGAGEPPKPCAQRLAGLLAQLAELERWETFGQHNARIQLCERAEALSAPPTDVPQRALEVQKLRKEWQALDQQHAGVPKALWKRFDAACEKAYAPAAKYFTELAARNKEARRRREEFTAAAAAHALTLLGDIRDWREIERWLRDTDRTWREGDLGSVNPDAWKKLDARLKVALAPLRDALSAARNQAKASRQVLIEEATALASEAMERDTPSRIRTIQIRWQEQAKAQPLAGRDERALWERFRAACDAVFNARQAKRKEDDVREGENRRALENLCVQFEQLALSADKDDQAIRRGMRDLQEQWKRQSGGSGPALRELESHFQRAGTAVEAMLSARTRSREAAVWETLAAKERLCDALDHLVQSGAAGTAESATRSAATQQQWLALPALTAAWEEKMLARRDAALGALSDAAAGGEYLARIERGVESRRQSLLELELSLGLDSPAEFQAQRLALQVNQLKARFKGTATVSADTPGERLLAWCAQAGVSSTLDRQRCERILSKIEKPRAKT
jgi:hypothetical protein